MDTFIKLRHLKVESLNNTRKAEMNVVFFNRVPKTGSETMMSLMDRLSKLNNFDHDENKPLQTMKPMLGEDEQKDLAEDISDLGEPVAYTQHVNYINFTQYNLPRPIYINLIRDPLERIISWYYYVRAPWYIVGRRNNFPNLPLPKPVWLKRSFEMCVEMKMPECTFPQDSLKATGGHSRQMLFFCGHSESDCFTFNSVSALQKAKKAVENDYAVVGSWEDTNVTLTVLENYIPRFFKGAKAVYHILKDALVNTNKNKYKPTVKNEIKELVRKNLTREYEFYHFCKQRLYKQYLALQIKRK